MRDSELYYGLFPYRNNEPQSIVIAAREELLRPLQLLHGVAGILHIHIKKSQDVSQIIVKIYEELAQVQEAIYDLLIEFSRGRALNFENPVTALREQILPYINQAQNVSKNMRTAEKEIISSMEDGNLWIEYVERATHEIWVIVDALTNPNLKLPIYLSHWLSVRDELNSQAKQGNMQISEALVNELENPEPNIRIEALIDLGHLKNVQTVPFIIKHLNDEFDEVKVWAIESLKKIGGPEANQALSKYYESQNN
jgi:hypothetical protein